MSTIDFSARYAVAGYDGIAFYLRGFHVEYGDVYDEWEEAEPIEDPSMVRAVMVGDDREHIIDVDDLTMISEDDYCDGCGQIGCGWHS
jgi:hypothetical protein